MLKKILVALDGSERAAGVLRTACEVAERFDAELCLLRVILIPPEFPAAAHAVVPDTLPTLMTAEAERGLDELVARVPAARSARRLVESGQPWRVILDTAARLDVDLIALGSHGYGGIDRLIGTTAAKVANHADRNVLVVHEHRAPKP